MSSDDDQPYKDVNLSVLRGLETTRRRPTGHVEDRLLRDQYVAAVLFDFAAACEGVSRMASLTEDEIAQRNAGFHMISTADDMPEEYMPALIRGRSIVELALKKLRGAPEPELDAAIQEVWRQAEHMQNGGL